MQNQDTFDTLPLLEIQTAKPKSGRIKGIIFMLLAVGNLHLTRLFVKLCYFVSEITVWEVITERALLVVLLCTITILIKDKSLLYIPPHLRWLLFWRCFFGTISFSLMFISLKYLTFSTSMILYFLYPIFTSIVGWLFLKERLTFFDVIALVTSLIGVILFAFPELFGEKPIHDKTPSEVEENTPEGIIMGFLQALFMSFAIILIRKIGKDIHSLTSPAYFQLFALVIYSVCLLVIGLTEGIKTHYTLELLLYLGASGLFGYFGLVCMALALQNEKAGRIATLEYVQIIFGFIIDIFLFKAEIGLSEIIGSILITISSLLITILKCTNRIK